MYKVGITEKGYVKVITDGRAVYQATKYSLTPHNWCPPISSVRRGAKGMGAIVYQSKRGGILTENKCRELDRVQKVDICPTSFDRYCATQGLKVKDCIAKDTSLGAWISRTIGSSTIEYYNHDCAEIFNHCQRIAQQWIDLDRAADEIRAEDRKKYIEKATKRWVKFFRIQNLSNIDSMSGKEFESAIALLYECKGYNVKMTASTGDFGVDVIAEKHRKVTVIQTKRHTNNIGVKAVQEVSAGAYYYKADHAAVITSSFFTNQAKKLADSTGVELIDRERLMEIWANTHKNDNIPIFELQEYEKIRHNIDRILGTQYVME
ncbi:restriction endonuclease [Thiocystis violacea]|uniref:restriction endonuclease n=1 Tax=Thiocystis violacea TaxID=13725 RepID=UPI0019051F3C|nr:restriction endonuclease [Thiocystis violacea]